jgi:hypothetical protein
MWVFIKNLQIGPFPTCIKGSAGNVASLMNLRDSASNVSNLARGVDAISRSGAILSRRRHQINSKISFCPTNNSTNLSCTKHVPTKVEVSNLSNPLRHWVQIKPVTGKYECTISFWILTNARPDWKLERFREGWARSRIAVNVRTPVHADDGNVMILAHVGIFVQIFIFIFFFALPKGNVNWFSWEKTRRPCFTIWSIEV